VSTLIALDYYTDAAQQLAIVLPEGQTSDSASEFMRVLASIYAPNLVVACGPEKHAAAVGLLKLKEPFDNLPTAYLCEGEICTAPTTDPMELKTKLTTTRTRTYSLGE